MNASEAIARLRELREKATSGRWEVGDLDRNGQRIVRNEHIELATLWHHSVGSIEKEMEANAAAIVAAMNSLESLLACAEALAMADELIHELADERTPAHVEMTPAEEALVAFRRHTRAALDALAEGGGE